MRWPQKSRNGLLAAELRPAIGRITFKTSDAERREITDKQRHGKILIHKGIRVIPKYICVPGMLDFIAEDLWRPTFNAYQIASSGLSPGQRLKSLVCVVCII